jgi:phage terminase large subunit-like protein
MAKKPTKTKRSYDPSPANGRRRPEYVKGFRWDPEAAESPIRFIEAFCRGVNEHGEPGPMRLMEWQKERVLRPLFGWKKPNGRLRYRRGALFVPKKNGGLAPAA